VALARFSLVLATIFLTGDTTKLALLPASIFLAS